MRHYFNRHPLIKAGFIWGSLLLISFCSIIYSQIGDYPQKIWLHRANSFEKMLEKESRFPNFEVDVVFRLNGTFDVTHDFDVTYQQSLNPYLQDIAADQDRMWLDIKNLTAGNALRMKMYLDSLCSQFHIRKEQLILESRNLSELKRFTDDGYYTSYYVDFPKPKELSAVHLDSCIHFLQRVADSEQVRALSFPGWWYEPISEKLCRSIDLLTWKHRSTESELWGLPNNRKMLIDPQLKVILVKSKGNYHR